MSLVLTFPTNYTLDTVVQEYVAQTENYIGSSIIPENSSDFQKVRWDEKDRERGMTAAHVMGTDPKTDVRQGSKTHEYEPIPFKETDVIREDEILRQRELGTMNETLNLGTLIAKIAKDRLDKTRIRMEWMRWQMLKGRVQVSENGVSVDETFPVQSHSVLHDWDDLANATPLKDINAGIKKFRGTGASARGSKLYMNQTTANWLLENANAADLKGYQNSNFLNVTYSLDQVNTILSSRGLPTIVVNEDFYIDENDVEQMFLDDAEVVWVGNRMGGQKPGDWMSTPSLHRYVNGKAAPGYFSIVEVGGKSGVGSISMEELGQSKNPKIEITGGIYGGTRLIYPRSVIKMVVAS